MHRAATPSVPLSGTERRSTPSRPIERRCLEQEETLECNGQPICRCRCKADRHARPDVGNRVAPPAKSPQLDRAVPAIGIKRVIVPTIFLDDMGFGLVETDIVEV